MWTKENITDQRGKTIIVTGANSGIGFQTALALYEAGAHVIVACRNESAAQIAIEEMKKGGGKGMLEAGLIDLSNLDSVRAFAAAFKNKNEQLHVLINNAGVMIPPPSLTTDGFESQFSTNFLGHFVLTALLYPVLRSTPHARIVTLTSLAYTSGSIDFDNLRLEKEYDAAREYSQSKLADIVFAVALQRRLHAAGESILSLAAHPGVTETELSRNMPKEAFDNAVNRYGKLMPAAQGALPSLFAAVSADVEPGGFYGPDQDGGLRGFPTKVEIRAVALDETVADRLWDVAEVSAGAKFL